VTAGPASRAYRRAVAVLFFANGLGVATWYSNIPLVRATVGPDPLEQGAALTGLGLGGLIGMPLAGRSRRLSGRGGAVTVILVFGAALTGVGMARTREWLFAALLLLGIANGLMVVVMNAHVIVVEEAGRRSLHARMYSFFGLGGITGAVLTAVLESAGVRPITHITGTGVLVVGLAGLVAPRLPADPTVVARGRTRSTSPLRVPLLGVLAAIALFHQSTIADWGGTYLVDEMGAGSSAAALPYGCFAAGLLTGQLVGDLAISRWGRWRTLGGGFVLAAVGLAQVVAATGVGLAAVGFAVSGLGAACAMPTVLGIAAREGGSRAETSMAFVATAGHAATVASPLAVGLVARTSGLVAAFVALAVALLIAGGHCSCHARRLTGTTPSQTRIDPGDGPGSPVTPNSWRQP